MRKAEGPESSEERRKKETEMETLEPTSASTPGAKGHLRQDPHTPPYTPYRAKRRFERSDSPASVSSIQPAETTSPAKKVAKRDVPDNVRVQELVEGDLGYVTDIDVVYPEELEEKLSSDSEDEGSDGDGDDSDTGISQRFQQLGCEDSQEAEFEKKRRENHLRRRTSSRLFKRAHSETIKGDSEVSDVEAMGDHDLSSTARRLRRRVQGPSGIEVFDAPRSSPEPRNTGLAAPFQMREHTQVRSATMHSSSDAQDSDDSDDSDSDSDDAMETR